MLKDVIDGKTYHAVAAQYGVTRTAVERRIKALALKLSKQVGIDGLNQEGLAFVQRLRACRSAIMVALDRYEPLAQKESRSKPILSDADIQLAIRRIVAHSAAATRDVALFYLLLTTGARPLEIARLEVRDYLDADGRVREESAMRADAAINRKARPLFFASEKATQAIDEYLAQRVQRRAGTSQRPEFRGLDPLSPLFLADTGECFEIVTDRAQGRARVLCRGIHDAYRKIFRRIGIEGVSALSVRRTLALRLYQRGAAEEQIGVVLGISDRKAVRQLLPRLERPLQSVVRDLV
jgi:integrase